MGTPKSTRSSIAKDPNAANEANCGLPMTLSQGEHGRHDNRCGP